MILFLNNGKQIRGDLISSSVLRSGLSPIPVTLEAELRAGDEDFESRLQQGCLLKDGFGDDFYIIKSERVSSRHAISENELAGYRITALLNNCLSVAYVRSRSVVKENATLSAIYRACGATIPPIENDFPVPRFCCLVGQTPSFHIARVLQEEGGVVRWKNSHLQFIRLQGILSGKVVRTLPETACKDVQTGFLEHHEVPWFYSLDAEGGFLFGNRDKPRLASFSPFKNVQRLRNLTRCLIHRKTVKILYDSNICAGDVIAFTGGSRYAVITAAHVFKSGTMDGGQNQAYTNLWLGEVEE